MSTNIQPPSGLGMMDVLTTGLNPWLLTVNPLSGLASFTQGGYLRETVGCIFYLISQSCNHDYSAASAP